MLFTVVGFGGGVTTYESKSNVSAFGKLACTLSGGGFNGGATTHKSKFDSTTCGNNFCTFSGGMSGCGGAAFKHFVAMA